MRILCLANRDLPSAVALNQLLPALAAAGHTVHVGLSERVGAGGSAGSSEPAGRRALRAAEQELPNRVVFPLVERAGLPDDGRRLLTFGEWGPRRGVPVQALPDPNGPAGLAALRAFVPDLVLTLRYGAILRPPAIAVPRLGVLNLHSGRLPEYRGVLATFRALLAGDRELGCTLHYIADASVDTGDVVGCTQLAVVPGESLLWHVLALYPDGIRLMLDAVARLAAGGTLAREPQPASEGAYYTYPTAAEWAGFADRGWAVVTPEDLTSTLARFGPQDGTAGEPGPAARASG